MENNFSKTKLKQKYFQKSMSIGKRGFLACRFKGRGQVVSVCAFYFDDLSSKPTGIYIKFLIYCMKGQKLKKEAGIILINSNVWKDVLEKEPPMYQTSKARPFCSHMSIIVFFFWTLIWVNPLRGLCYWRFYAVNNLRRNRNEFGKAQRT